MVLGNKITYVLWKWWYREMPQRFFSYFLKIFVFLFDFFSISICLRTLFSVWKRDLIDYQGLSLPDIFQAMTLNFASRFIGFLVKTLNIIAYTLIAFVYTAFTIVFLVFWYFYPLVILFLLTNGTRIILGG